MAIQQRLHTKLVQKLILTPSLQQAIKLLPMSTLELAEMLNQEVVENPMLEETPSDDIRANDQIAQTEREDGAGEPPKPTTGPESWDDKDYAYFFGDYLDDGSRGNRAPVEVKELPPIENTLSTQHSLAEHLEWQLTMSTDDDTVREIGGGSCSRIAAITLAWL